MKAFDRRVPNKIKMIESWNRITQGFLWCLELVTNVPLTDTVDIIINLIFYNKSQSYLILNRISFINLLDNATRNFFFLCKNNCTMWGLWMGLPYLHYLRKCLFRFSRKIMAKQLPSLFKSVFYLFDMSTTRLFVLWQVTSVLVSELFKPGA